MSWDAVYNAWRRGDQLWLMTYGGGPSGGYIIDYSVRPRVVSRWHERFGQDTVITPLPTTRRLLYTNRREDTPEGHVHEFIVAQVEAMNLEELDYAYATEWYEDIWEDFPMEESVQDAPNVPDDFGVMSYEGPNWQDEGATGTITITERRHLSTNCPFRQCDFTNGQFIAKYRCGHAVCTNCYKTAIHRGWHRCTFCRGSGTTRRTRAIIWARSR